MSPAARTAASAPARSSGGQGYSVTPLAKKLGIGTGHRVWLAQAPANYKTLLAPLPEGVTFVTKASTTTDVAHVFASQRRDLEKVLRTLRTALKPDAAIWVSWPKNFALRLHHCAGSSFSSAPGFSSVSR